MFLVHSDISRDLSNDSGEKSTSIPSDLSVTMSDVLRIFMDLPLFIA
jgi:hypothetical protein